MIVIGGGGHAKVVINALRESGIKILGLCDVDRSKDASTVLSVPVLGDDSIIDRFDKDEVDLAMGIGSTGRSDARRALFETYRGADYRFVTVRDRSSVIAADVILDEGAQVLAGAVIQPATHVGANAIINTRASVDHDCIVGDHAHVAPGATLCGGVQVGEGAHIGAGAVVVQNVSVGANSVVGAGSVVLADVDEGQTVLGAPARESK